MISGVYADTGVMVKTYIWEPDSAKAIALIEETNSLLLFSHIHSLEIPNAFRLKHFRSEITKTQEAAANRAFLKDVESGVLTPCEYDLTEVFRVAERLSAKHSAVIGSRSLDLIHIAVALESECTHFLSFDERQRKVAKLSGLKVLPV